MNTLEAANYINFKQVPEGWHGLAISLLERILDASSDPSIPNEVSEKFTIESIDINKSGKLVVSGLHIKHFESEIIEVSEVAKNTCLICGNYGEITKLSNQINMPLCGHHAILALEI